jgi:hypothetical protein
VRNIFAISDCGGDRLEANNVIKLLKDYDALDLCVCAHESRSLRIERVVKKERNMIGKHMSHPPSLVLFLLLLQED